MNKRKNFSSGAVWEDIFGYSRAVKVGSIVEISGTTSVEGDKVIGESDPYVQTVEIISKIKNVIEKAGGSLNDITRVRIYLVNINDWEEVGSAFSKFFRSVKPAATLVEVKGLIDPKLLVEIEATAIIPDNN